MTGRRKSNEATSVGHSEDRVMFLTVVILRGPVRGSLRGCQASPPYAAAERPDRRCGQTGRVHVVTLQSVRIQVRLSVLLVAETMPRSARSY